MKFIPQSKNVFWRSPVLPWERADEFSPFR
jgi:hypothetical protein